MNVAFIPVRGGSKSIPLKNIKEICGKPLVYWCMKAACECKDIDKVYISTDSERIKEVVNELINENDIFQKVEIVDRSEESSKDNASTESAMLEFAEKYDFDNIVLIQATSPLLDSEDLKKGFEIMNQQNIDSVLSCVKQRRFIWNEKKDGTVEPNNYDVFNRPRRQEFDGYLLENGAFYITSKELLMQSKNRVSGDIGVCVMDESTAIEIDETADWEFVEWLLNEKNKDMNKNIKMFLTDCDGCLTDGGMYYSEEGDELKKFNTRDGMGFSLLKKRGIVVGIITSEEVKLNERRANKLDLDILLSGCKDKKSAIKDILKEYNVSLDEVCYIGDDINDLELIKSVGFGCCPNDAVDKIKKAADYIASCKGGDGVIREIADLILSNK